MFAKFYSDDGKFINEYYMSASDIKIMSDNGMVIGGHSYSHPFLNKIPIDKMQKEIDRSMAFLRQVTNKNIKIDQVTSNIQLKQEETCTTEFYGT